MVPDGLYLGVRSFGYCAWLAPAWLRGCGRAAAHVWAEPAARDTGHHRPGVWRLRFQKVCIRDHLVVEHCLPLHDLEGMGEQLRTFGQPAPRNTGHH